MTLAAEAPDLDVCWGFKGPVLSFAHHRGFTHSFLGLVLVSFVATGFMYLVWLIRGRRTNIPDLPPRWPLLLGFAYIAGLSHILLDFTNNYGVRPFWPFSEKWYSWDIVFIVEPALYILLILGLSLPAVFSRAKPLPRGRAAARVALLCVVALYALRDHEHRRALEALAKTAFRYGSSQPTVPLRASAYPYYWSIFRWYAVAEMKDFFASSEIDARSGEIDPGELELVGKPPETPATAAAKRSYLGRVYLDWARYPLVTESSSGEDSIVRFRDLRFDYPPLRGRITLSGSVELDRNLRVVRQTFGAKEQSRPVD
jgi:inner membrane protein